MLGLITGIQLDIFFSDNYYVKFNVLRAMQQQQLPSYAGKQKVKGETVAITQGL